jgi:hypothetical protein
MFWWSACLPVDTVVSVVYHDKNPTHGVLILLKNNLFLSFNSWQLAHFSKLDICALIIIFKHLPQRETNAWSPRSMALEENTLTITHRCGWNMLRKITIWCSYKPWPHHPKIGTFINLHVTFILNEAND